MGGDLNNQEKDILKVVDFSTDESNSTEESLKVPLEEDFSERKILPYTKPLPELPDEEENNSTLYGVDSNGNGVRDDLEIIVVKEFGYDKELTEVIFADLRTSNYNMYLANNLADENGKVPLEYEEEITDNSSYSQRCRSRLEDDLYNTLKGKIYSQVYNTREREGLRKVVRRSIYGGTPVPEINQKACQEFIQKTKEKYSNF